MKLKYIFASIVAALALVSCEKEADHYLDSIKVSSSYVSLNTGVGANTPITVTATDSWYVSVDEDAAKWLTVSPTMGGAGETTLNFSASAGEGRTAEVLIKCGDQTQRINVIQGIATVSVATCADVIAGPDSKLYRVTGVCTGIYNTTYGNWYLTDNTGTITIYGTLDAKGNTKNFLSLGLEVGDEVTVEGPKTTYGTTIELVDVTVLKINKSLIKVEEVVYADPDLKAVEVAGGDVQVMLTSKGTTGIDVTIPDEAKSWLGVTTVDAARGIVTLTARPNEGGDRSAVVSFGTTDGKKRYTTEATIDQKGAIKNVTVAEFLAAAEGSSVYRLNGLITGLYASDSQGKSFYIQDYSGSVLVYRAEGFETSGAKVGDIVTVCGKRTSYKETPQMGSATFEAIDKVVTVVKVADFLAAAESKDVWYMISGTVEKPTEEGTKWDIETYGNLNLRDETGSVYVYGVSTGINGESKKFGTLGVKEGDKMTIIGYRTSYKGLNQVGGGMYVSHEAGGGQGGGGGDTSKGKYVVVSSTQTDWAGKYLIVWESGAHGTASSKDLAKTVDVTIADGTIAASEEINAAAVTVAAMEGGYSISLSNGKFLTFTTNGNQCTFADAAVPMNFGYTDTGIKVYGMDTADNTRYLMMNATGSTPYFRGYKETSFIKEGSWVQGYSYPQLYKFVAQ